MVIRNIESDVKMRLQHRAKRHGQSMKEEVRDILPNTSKDEEASHGGLGTDIAALFARAGLKNDIAELRGHAAKQASFD